MVKHELSIGIKFFFIANWHSYAKFNAAKETWPEEVSRIKLNIFMMIKSLWRYDEDAK